MISYVFLLIQITMNSMSLVLTRVIITLLIIILLSPISCFSISQSQPQNLPTTTTTPPTTSQGDLLAAEKTRLGSRPPSCHNKCNACHPCMAVQVPTAPGREPVRPGQDRSGPVSYFDSPRNKYSNYKPLGWKCRCGDHLFNP